MERMEEMQYSIRILCHLVKNEKGYGCLQNANKIRSAPGNSNSIIFFMMRGSSYFKIEYVEDIIVYYSDITRLMIPSKNANDDLGKFCTNMLHKKEYRF